MLHLYNSSGKWIGFRIDNHVFNIRCEWIGWLPWADPHVVTREGDYFGTIVDGKRLYRFSDLAVQGNPGRPIEPSRPAYPGYPGMEGFATLPDKATDIASLPGE